MSTYSANFNKEALASTQEKVEVEKKGDVKAADKVTVNAIVTERTGGMEYSAFHDNVVDKVVIEKKGDVIAHDKVVVQPGVYHQSGGSSYSAFDNTVEKTDVQKKGEAFKGEKKVFATNTQGSGGQAYVAPVENAFVVPKKGTPWVPKHLRPENQQQQQAPQ